MGVKSAQQDVGSVTADVLAEGRSKCYQVRPLRNETKNPGGRNVFGIPLLNLNSHHFIYPAFQHSLKAFKST